MVDKKGQGISISFIVVAAIAALVLVLVIAFATGGLGKFFGSIFRATPGEEETDIKVYQTQCQEYCDKAKLGGYGAWDETKYCTQMFGVDMNGDGIINGTTERFQCWEHPLAIPCTSVMTDAYGYGISCTEDECNTTAPNVGCPGSCCYTDLTITNPTDCEDAGQSWGQNNACSP